MELDLRRFSTNTEAKDNSFLKFGFKPSNSMLDTSAINFSKLDSKHIITEREEKDSYFDKVDRQEMKALTVYTRANYPALLTINESNSKLALEVEKEKDPYFLVIKAANEEDIHKVPILSRASSTNCGHQPRTGTEPFRAAMKRQRKQNLRSIFYFQPAKPNSLVE